MNINNVSKLFGDMSSQEVRTLELRIGQVVRGVVTQQLPNQEALVNINGVQVKAKLEIPILEGQATLMQVAPDSKGSYIHLKQVDPATVGLHDPMKDILKSMQLPDKEWSNQLVRELRQEGFPLNRETLQALAQAVKERPPHIDLENWMQAASQAFKRGMPMTAASIMAMHQLSQGVPLHQLVSQLQQQLTQLLQLQGNQLNTQTSQLLQQLSQSLVSQGQALQIGANQNQAQQTMQAQGNQAGNHATVAQMQNPIASFLKLLGVQHENVLSQQLYRGEQASQTGASQTGASQTAASQTGASQTQPSQIQAGQLQVQANLASQQQGVTGQGLTSQLNTGQTLGMTSGALQNATPNQAQSHMQATAVQLNQTQTNNQSLSTPTTTSTVNQSQPILNPVVQPSTQSGVNIINQSSANSVSQQAVMSLDQQTASNQQLSGQQAQVQATAATQGQPTTLQAASTVSAGQSGVQTMLQNQAEPIHAQSNQVLNNSQATDSIKATVLNLLQMTDVPVAMKESLAQLLNHITGQQLMLAAERNHSMFTHITMFIPINDDQGGQTAAVHVQTRRDRKGQLDAENCRIVFDLNMKQLGQTLVDMNVTNKIVSLNIWNDHSFVQNLLDSMRPDIYEALQKTGYSLSSIKATPFKKEEQLDEAKAIVQPPAIQQINAARYKGVDFKI